MHSLEPYPPGKPIDELEREYGVTDSIKLASNENPLGPSPKALAAMQAALADVHRYPDGSCFHLRRALARKLRVVARGAHLRQRLERDHRAHRAHLPARRRGSGDGGPGVRHLPHAGAGAGRQAASSCRCATSPTTSRRWPRRSRRRRAWCSSPTPTTRPARSSSASSGRSSSPPCRATSSSSWTRPTPSSSRTRATRTRSPTCGGDHLLIVLRTFSKIYGLAGLRVGYGVAHPEHHRPAEPPARAVQRQHAGAGGGARGARRRRARRAHPRRSTARAWPTCARRSPASASSACRAGRTSSSCEVGNAARLYDALLRQGVIVRPVPVYGFPEHVRVTVGTRGGERAPRARRSRSVLAARRGVALLFERAAIAGVGLIGGSLALAARAAGLIGEVVGIGRSEANLATALRARHRRPHQRAIPPTSAAVDLRRARRAGAQHRGGGARAAAAPARRARWSPTSAASRARSSTRVEAVLPADRPFVGAHPIAGSERAGAAAADAAISSAARRCIADADARAPTPRRWRACAALWEGVGARVEEMTPAAHDRALAWTSHLPHALAYALVRRARRAPIRRCSRARRPELARRDARRGEPGELWRDIFLANADAGRRRARRASAPSSSALRAAIAAGDAAALRALLDGGAWRRDAAQRGRARERRRASRSRPLARAARRDRARAGLEVDHQPRAAARGARRRALGARRRAVQRRHALHGRGAARARRRGRGRRGGGAHRGRRRRRRAGRRRAPSSSSATPARRCASSSPRSASATAAIASTAAPRMRERPIQRSRRRAARSSARRRCSATAAARRWRSRRDGLPGGATRARAASAAASSSPALLHGRAVRDARRRRSTCAAR